MYNPAHVPLLMDKRIVQEMEEIWQEQFDYTAACRFRSPKTVTLLYLYVHYILNKPVPHTAVTIGTTMGEATTEYCFAELRAAHLEKILEYRPKFFTVQDFAKAKDVHLEKYLSKLYPRPSKFEL
jgi:hypothetical protein